ncbi:hypothetical protein RQN30_01870 [Arcanobacterium hippocoleae]
MDNEKNSKVRVALIYGGRSGEHSISCATAGAVMSVLNPEKFEVLSIAIRKDGTWVPGETDPEKLKLNGATTVVAENPDRIVLAAGDGSQDVLRVHDALGVNGEPQVELLGKIDVAFPLLHGPFGEDGTVQGLLEMANIPYVGCGVFASAAGMDKDFMKLVLRSRGIEVSPWVAITKKNWERGREEVLRQVSNLEFPVYVKPARAGSSLGITRVDSISGVAAAVEKAQQHDPKVLVEQGLLAVKLSVRCLAAVVSGIRVQLFRVKLPLRKPVMGFMISNISI